MTPLRIGSSCVALVGCIVWLVVLAHAVAAEATGATACDPATAWRMIEPFFQPPAEFANQLGSYRSPWLFNDGTRVQTAADWPRRRKEIADTWTALMGPWPTVIEKPKVEVLSKSRRENFTQYRVRLEIAPDQTGEGWLLIPD